MIKWLPYMIDITSLFIWLKSHSYQTAKASRWQLITILSAVAYMMIVSYLTLAPTSYAFVGNQQVAPMIIGSAPVNLIPFWSTTADFYQNVLMMMPMGIYIRLLLPNLKFKKVILTGVVISTGIEMLQFILDEWVGLSRWVDINDVLTNAFGVALGWLIIVGLAYTPVKRIILPFVISLFSR